MISTTSLIFSLKKNKKFFLGNLYKFSNNNNNNYYSKRFFNSTLNNSCLVIAEHDQQKIQPSTLSTITAATKLSNNIMVLLAGHFKEKNIVKQLTKIEGVNKVIFVDKEIYDHGIAESLSSLIKNCQNYFKCNYILAPSTTFGKNLLPRVASILDVSAISDIISIQSEDTFVRPIYAGNALSTIKSLDPIKIMTVRATAFEKAKERQQECEIISLPKELIDIEEISIPKWIKDEMKDSTRPDLTSARVVVSGGRGMKSGENFKLLETLADQLGAAVGASRAAVDAGFVSNDLQVGQTGKIVAPEFYIAIGISGAIQHLAGMKDSKIIVAINKDPEAPIFQVADVGIVGDLFTIVPEMIEEIKKRK